MTKCQITCSEPGVFWAPGQLGPQGTVAHFAWLVIHISFIFLFFNMDRSSQACYKSEGTELRLHSNQNAPYLLWKKANTLN